LVACGKKSLNDYYISRSEPAEQNAVAQVVGLAKQIGARVHVVHLASGAGAQLIGWAKSVGIDITAETCAHYLMFTHEDFKKMGSLIKCAPVVKEGSDRATLWQLLSDGVIDFLASDHAPCPLKEKKTDNAWRAYGGMPGVQILLPFIFSEGFKKNRISLARLIEITSANAAKRFGLYPKKGRLASGSDADIVIIDPKKSWTVSNKNMLSKGRWTPFTGRKFEGRIEYTILRGKIVYSHKRGVSRRPTGRWVSL